MSALYHATPDSVASEYGSGIYESNAFSIIEVPQWVVDQLEAVKSNAGEYDRVINEYLKGKGDKLGETREQFNALIEYQLNNAAAKK